MEEEIITTEEEVFDLKKFRYILDSDGYICHGSFGGLIVCNLGECTEYNGEIPNGYSTIEEWFDGEIDKLNAWKIIENNLVFDENKYNELQIKYQKELEENEYATKGWVRKQGNKTESIVIDELSNEIEGSSLILLNDSGNYPIDKIDIECEDETISNIKVISSNKNLLGITNVSEEINGINITVNNDGSIKLNGTATNDIEFDLIGDSINQEMLFLLKNNTNYFLSGLEKEAIELYSFDGTDKTLIGSYKNELINLSNDYIVTQAVLKIFNGSSYNNVLIYPQIEINEVATDFIKHEETSGYVTTYNKKASITTLSSYQPKTIIMVDKIANLNVKYFKYKYLDEKFSSIETKSNEIQMIVSQNNETIEQLTNQTNKLIASTDGFQNILENRGGNNLLRNTFFYEYENGLLTYWSGVQKVVEKYESKSRNALSLQNGVIKQSVSLINKNYCLSFKYIKLSTIANAKLIVNSKEYVLNSDLDIENFYELVVDVNTDNITIEFECDTNDGFLIYEVMLNEGNTPSIFNQNASESISDTVKIGKGIEVIASNINNKTRIDADGLRGINTDTDEIVFYQTTDGIYGKELETESIKSGNLIITTRNGHNFLSGL